MVFFRMTARLIHFIIGCIGISALSLASQIVLASDTHLTSLAKAAESKEAELNNIANHLTQYSFVPLEMGNTTKTMWVLKNKSGQNAALLKCTSGNNYAQAEIATYQLGKLLNSNLYPVTVSVTLDKSLAKKLQLTSPVCALKEWVTHYAVFYWKSQGRLEQVIQKKNEYAAYKAKNTFLSSTGDKKKLADSLMGENKLSDIQHATMIFASTKTLNGHPILNKTRTWFVTDKVPLMETVKDFSNLMVIDALTGNNDRFPGGNLEFRSKTNESKSLGNQTVKLLNPRLSSLDTGCAFKGDSITWGRLQMMYYLRRFDPVMIQNLRALLDQVNHLTSDDLKGKWSFLAFNTKNHSSITALTYLKNNIKWVLNFVESVKRHQNKEYIPNKYRSNEIWLE